MPMQLDESISIIRLALSAQVGDNYQWIIKIHPAISKENFKKFVPESLDKRFSFSDKKLTDLFENSKLLVTAASSVAVEAVVCGVYVAIIGNLSGPTKNPLLNTVDKSYWSVCFTPKDLELAVNNKFPEQDLVLSSYLNPITEEGVISMMNFEQ